MIKVAAAGGGTGGHLYPLLAIIEALAKRVDVKVLFFAVKGKIDERVVRKDHPEFETVSIDVRGLHRPLHHPKNLWRALKIGIATIEVKKYLKRFKPDLIILTGGYISGVVGLAAKDLGIPIFVHEQNVVPGLAVKVLSQYAKKVFVSFERTRDYLREWRDKIVVTGCPVRETEKEAPLKDFVLVLGGSLGSEAINELMEKVYPELPEILFVHSTGSDDWTERLSAFPNVTALTYIDPVGAYWKKAIASISRAGASTIAEMMYYGVPGILIPWEGSAESHQLENALEAERLGYGIVIREKEASPRKIIESIDKVVKKGKIEKMKENPASKISEEILGEIM